MQLQACTQAKPHALPACQNYDVCLCLVIFDQRQSVCESVSQCLSVPKWINAKQSESPCESMLKYMKQCQTLKQWETF